jgi:hypothetical protein
VYFLIQDFKLGLDARRFLLNSPPGSLVTLRNAHITPGGEIEKRKKFGRGLLPSNAYGLEVTEDGFITFGSEDMAFTSTSFTATGTSLVFNVGFGHTVPVGTVVSIGTNGEGLSSSGTVTASTTTTLTVTVAQGPGGGNGAYSDTIAIAVLYFPGTVYYQRLQHPDGATAMTALIHSTVYNGLAFAIASFGGAKFAFYDGVVCYDFFSGQAASWLTSNSGLAAHLSALINRSAAFSSSSALSVVTVTSPSGLSTEVTVEKSTAAGTLVDALTRTQVDGITGVSAQGQFSIQAGKVAAGTSKVTSVLVGGQELLGASVDYVTNNDTTAAAVKDAINARQATVMATTFRTRASNVATLTMAAHKFLVGDIVTVAGVTNAVGGNYNGTVTITAVAATTISYANTGTNEGSTADVGGTVTIGTRIYTAAVDENVVQIIASATGTAANSKVVSVTTAANAAGGICIDQYSFTLTQTSGATITVPTLSAIYINGVEVLGGPASGTTIEDKVADAAAKIIASATTGYTATAIGSTLYISRLTTTSSSFPITVIVVVDASGGVVTGPTDAIIVTPGPENLTQFGPATLGLTSFVGGTGAFVNVAGGTPPYSYLWSIPSGEGFTAGTPVAKGSNPSGVPKIEFLGTGAAVDATVRAPLLKITRNAFDAFEPPGTFHQNNYEGTVRVTVTDSNSVRPKVASADLSMAFKFYNYA